MKCYDQCPKWVHERVEALVGKFHQELQVAEVTFDLLFVARDDDEGTGSPSSARRTTSTSAAARPVLTLHGVAALAIARIVPAKERAKGCRDAEILIDRDRFTNMPVAKQEALLDHELQHFEVQRDAEGGIKTDAGHRPKLSMRHHDYDFGWFEVIARRHGEASIEVQQAQLMYDEAGQVLFPFLGSATHSTGFAGT